MYYHHFFEKSVLNSPFFRIFVQKLSITKVGKYV